MDNLNNAKNIAVAAVKYYLNETVLTCYATFNLFGSHKDFPDIMNRQTDSTKFFSVAAVVPQPISCFYFCFNFCKVDISFTCFPFFASCSNSCKQCYNEYAGQNRNSQFQNKIHYAVKLMFVFNLCFQSEMLIKKSELRVRKRETCK